MKLIIKLAGASLMALALTGCFNGSSSGNSSSENPQPGMAVDFATFVKAEFDNPNPNREPKQINDIEFSFNDQNNPQAFDDLLR